MLECLERAGKQEGQSPVLSGMCLKNNTKCQPCFCWDVLELGCILENTIDSEFLGKGRMYIYSLTSTSVATYTQVRNAEI